MQNALNMKNPTLKICKIQNKKFWTVKKGIRHSFNKAWKKRSFYKASKSDELCLCCLKIICQGRYTDISYCHWKSGVVTSDNDD